MQMVSLTLCILYRPEISHLLSIYQNLGIDYDEHILPSIGNEVLKSIVTQFDAGELITQREIVLLRIREDLVKRVIEFNIQLEDVLITYMTFGKDFMNAKQEKLASIICAEGDAQVAELISQALKKAGKSLIEFCHIEVSKNIVLTLAQVKNMMYLLSSGEKNGGSNILLNLIGVLDGGRE
ncbi:hypothetical protein BC936DRAFT_139371, partial [Jimgerdemannia flammicorona]